MKIKVHTYDLQDLVIALCCVETGPVLTEDVKNRLSDALMELNNLCTEDNDYTITITVDT